MPTTYNGRAQAVEGLLFTLCNPHPPLCSAGYVATTHIHSIFLFIALRCVAICWPATHITLTLLNHEQRPALCWAVIGTTTCYSRSIQLWVTSNIGPAPAPAPRIAQPTSPSPLRRSLLASASGMRDEWIRLRRRRWDWNEVNRKCVLPAGVIYFIMAWAYMLRSEWELSRCG